MDYAYKGEILTPSKCGKMDQACAFGSGRPVVMIHDGEDLKVEELKVKKTLYYLVVDLGYPYKSTTQILSALQSAYPIPREGKDDEAAHTLFGTFNVSVTNEAINVDIGNIFYQLKYCFYY